MNQEPWEFSRKWLYSKNKQKNPLFVNSGFISYIKYGVLNKCYLLQKHLIISGDVPELSFLSNISAQYTCWVMNFILAHSPYLTFKRQKKSQPKPQKGIYYMIFSLTLLHKERLKAILSVTKEIWFDSSSVKDCRKSNKFNAKNDINEVVRLAGSVYSAFPECQCGGCVMFFCFEKKKKIPNLSGQTEAGDEETKHLFTITHMLMQHLVHRNTSACLCSCMWCTWFGAFGHGKMITSAIF